MQKRADAAQRSVCAARYAESMTSNDLKFEQARPLLESTDRSVRSIAAEVKMPERTLRRHIEKKAPELARTARSYAEMNGDTAKISSRPYASGRAAPEPADLLRKHNLNPDEWVVTSIRVSEWGNPDDPMFQLRVNATRKDSLLIIPDLSQYQLPDLGTIEEFAEGSVIFRSDQHLPYNNKPLNRAVLRYINLAEPGLIVFTGDLADWSIISKHRTHPRYKAMLNETNDAVVRHLWETRMAAPNAQIVFIPGNHDYRILYASREVAEGAYEGVRPGVIPGREPKPESLGFRALWELDELGIELVDEDWKLAKYNITEHLTARHGYLTGKNAEEKLLEDHVKSQVHGHIHRGSVIYKTKHDPLDIRVVMDAGTEAEVNEDGLGYQPSPDWTPGVGIGNIWNDGMFVLNFAPFVKNYLLLPDGERISGEEK